MRAGFGGSAPGATYKGETFTDLPAQSREIQADVMYNVVWEGIDVIVHIEFQRRHDDMILGLQQANQEKLLPLAFAFAALIFTEDDDRQWLKRRFAMLHDILESSWAYQEMVQEASEKALEKGLQLGQQKELQKQRQALTTYAEKHFPALVPLLKRQIDATDDPEVLQHLLIDLFSVDDKEEAERTILNSFVLPE